MGQEDPSFYPPQQTSAGDGGLADSYGGQGIFTGGILVVCRGLKSESDPGGIGFAPMKWTSYFIGQAFHRAGTEIAEKGRF